MADVTGSVYETFDGKEYRLRLTMGGLAKLQGKHGNDLGGVLSGKVGAIPPFGVMLDIVAVALEKGGTGADEAAELADEMMTADPKLVERVLKGAFPDMVGNAEAAPKPAKK